MDTLSTTFQLLVHHDTLPDGAPMTIRCILPQDTALLRAFHKRLKFESIYLRYLSYHEELTKDEAVHLCSVDYDSRMAFVATCCEAGEEYIVGVVRYDTLGSDHPHCARVTIVVQDDYQRRGLGTLLFDRLVSYARFRGFQKLVATFVLENTGFLKLLRRSGLPLNLLSFELGRLEANILLDVAPRI